jgi:heterodisulfide reductase subunit B
MRVNEVLKEVDMEYKGTINVYHTAELLYNDKFIGVDKVRDSVTNPLTGARIAVHYGCHLTKPHKDREFEKEVMLNTEHPTWMEELVAATRCDSGRVPQQDAVLWCRRGCPGLRYRPFTGHHQREAD